LNSRPSFHYAKQVLYHLSSAPSLDLKVFLIQIKNAGQNDEQDLKASVGKSLENQHMAILDYSTVIA
jgi:hypothetical protein